MFLSDLNKFSIKLLPADDKNKSRFMSLFQKINEILTITTPEEGYNFSHSLESSSETEWYFNEIESLSLLLKVNLLMDDRVNNMNLINNF
jgi:hypothetical protein